MMMIMIIKERGLQNRIRQQGKSACVYIYSYMYVHETQI